LFPLCISYVVVLSFFLYRGRSLCICFFIPVVFVLNSVRPVFRSFLLLLFLYLLISLFPYLVSYSGCSLFRYCLR